MHSDGIAGELVDIAFNDEQKADAVRSNIPTGRRFRLRANTACQLCLVMKSSWPVSASGHERARLFPRSAKTRMPTRPGKRRLEQTRTLKDVRITFGNWDRLEQATSIRETDRRQQHLKGCATL
jgi:hypothetical protein